MVKHGRILHLSLVACVSLVACNKTPPPPFKDWTAERPLSNNDAAGQFKLYVEAADEAESSAPTLCDRVSFTPGMKLEAIRKLKPAVATLQKAVRGSSAFAFEPLPVGHTPPHQRGWRLLGRVLAWRIERAIAEGREEDLVPDVVLAIRFGFVLTGGSATDASLGFGIALDAIDASAPGLAAMSASDLHSLAEGVAKALAGKPPISIAIANEKVNMLMAVQFVQDSYRTAHYEELSALIGPDSREAVAYLKQLESKDKTERPAYFQGFVSEAEAKTKWLLASAGSPAVSRPAPPNLKDAVRPWKRFAKHFFDAANPILDLNDLVLARTRLLLIDATVRAAILKNHIAPPSIKIFGKEWITDPYSGRPFIYRAEGVDYRLYSVGANFEDDGGDSDEAGLAPDLLLAGGN